MIKKLILALLFATTVKAQYQITGTMFPPEKGGWVLLHKINGAKQEYLMNTTIKVSTYEEAGQKEEIGTFEFKLPPDATNGSYRLTYESGFVDFLFNEEDISMVFNPAEPIQSIIFTKSLENKVYIEYLDAQSFQQRKIDSLQERYFKLPTRRTKKSYKKEVSKLEDIQRIYENKSGGMLANIFIKSSEIDYKSSPFDNVSEYRNYTVEHFFDNVDFDDETLIKSPFLINKIADYIFYLNVAKTQALQQDLYKSSIRTVFNKVDDKKLKFSFVKYLISTFTEKRNSEIVDWLFSEYFDKLVTDPKDAAFKTKNLDALSVSVGREAPDFSWEENGFNVKLSSLNDGDLYLLIFWSTQCGHCVKTLPDLHKALEGRKDISTVAFAIENEGNEPDFKMWKKNKLYNFHNAIGTHPESSFKNEIARKYKITETPTFFILDKAKNIIAVPTHSKDVKDYLGIKSKEH